MLGQVIEGLLRWGFSGQRGRTGVFSVLLLLAVGLTGPLNGQELRARVESDLEVVLDGDLWFEAAPLRGEGLLALAERICGDRAAADSIAEANGSERRLRVGARYRIPYDCARAPLQARGLSALFPEDRPGADEWLHRVGGRPGGEGVGLWRIAVWFTGNGAHYTQIRAHNQLADEEIDAGQWLRIPRHLLLPVFEGMLPASSTRSSEPSAPTLAAAAAFAESLSYGRDARGPYASYRLRGGEALYSSVVVRFTGRLLAKDVNPLAYEIAERSDISDLTDIPIGREIKIPLEYLSRQYLPEGDPRRVEYERERSAAAQYTNTVRSAGLRGVTVILDSGHGGQDVGASKGGIWESVYVYDIVERVKRRLQQRTEAKVLTTMRDGSGYTIPAKDVLPLSRGHRVLTTPPYPNKDSRISANLRWALSNSILREQTRAGATDDNVVFISIHADSLHPSVRGTMAYVPGLLPLRSNYRLTSSVYRGRKEVREQGPVSFAHKERVRSLGLSRDLANHMIASVRSHGIRIHPNEPVRDRIIRSRRPWVPAVLKYNAVPAKILIEVCNLANVEDLKLMKTQEFRESFAEAVVDGLLAYYATSGGGRSTAAN